MLATKTVTNGVPSDETLDTAAIQAAINACPVGQAVRLATDGDKTAFVSAGLTLKAGVTLWLDTGTTLFASHDPREFDAVAGKCGGNGTGNNAVQAPDQPSPARSTPASSARAPSTGAAANR